MTTSETTKKRVRRTANIVPTARDKEVFFQVWSHRFLNTFHIQKIVQPSWNISNLRNRLKSYITNGYLQHPQALKGVWREGGGTDPKVYELASEALSYLVEDYGIEEKYLTLYHRAPKSERPHITHTLLTSEVMANVYHAASAHGIEIIDQHTLIRDYSASQRDLRGEGTRGWWVPMYTDYDIFEDAYIKPDRMFALKYPGLPEGRNKRLFFVEADTGTEPLSTIEKKYRHYRATAKTQVLKEHFPDFGVFHVLFVTQKPSRAKNMMERCVASSAAWQRFLITDMESVKTISAEAPQTFFSVPWYSGHTGAEEMLENIVRGDLSSS